MFCLFDINKKGSFSKEEFMQIFRHSPMYLKDPNQAQENINKCFAYIKEIYGNTEITPREFYDLVNYTSSTK